MMLRRMYHVSSITYNLKKQGLKLSKMLNPKSKKQWYPHAEVGNLMPSMKSLTKVEREPAKRGVRRLAMLNKLFMKHITDLMSTGTVAMDVVGRGIEVSKVNISQDFHTVNVFWVCKGDAKDVETEAILSSVAGALRHELSTLRVMGEVPYIVFVKDKDEARLVDLDRRLAEADYGDDYQLTEPGHLLKTEFTLNTTLSPEMKAKIKQLEEEQPLEEDPIPEMTHNVYGLDHYQMMNRLLASRRKTKDAWSQFEEGSPVITYRSPAVKPDGIDPAKQKQELADFLHKRQILQNKIHKEMRTETKDWQMSKEEEEDVDEEYYEDYSPEDEDEHYDPYERR